ncbi:Uncharacterised protein [Candidatus Burarchaeum australiense]|nr:Uncharacterised protein [Candidatus Burarchaeum australiense]
MSSKRAQASMEYLLTHGWALLVLVLIIVVLYGLGIFNPNRYVSEECVFQPGFGCAIPPRLQLADPAVDPLNKYLFGVQFTNNLGYDIAITAMNVTSTDFLVSGQYECSTVDPISPDAIIKSKTECMDWYTPVWDPVAGTYTAATSYPEMLLNGQTGVINLVFKKPTDATNEAHMAVGETRELRFSITYRNCNTATIAATPGSPGGWPRGSLSPADPLYDPLSSYDSCTDPLAGTSEHVISGRILVRAGPVIPNAIYVTQ